METFHLHLVIPWLPGDLQISATSDRNTSWHARLHHDFSMHHPSLWICPLIGKLLFHPRHVATGQLIQDGLEVIQNHGIREEFEDKSELPKWVDTNWEDGFKVTGHGTDIDNCENDGQSHGGHHDCEAGRDAHEFPEAEVVPSADVVEKTACREDPPRIADSISHW